MRSKDTVQLAKMLLFVSLQLLHIRCGSGFSSIPEIVFKPHQQPTPVSFFSLNSEVQTPNTSIESAFSDDDDEDDVNTNDTPTLTGALENSILNEFILTEHKPLGCSVEESLADEPDNAKHVFVAEVTDGGNAAKSGIKVGDVIVQLSGTFDEVVNVAGLGIDKIRSLVGGRHEDSPLVIRVARGSDLMERHELALVELCIIGDDAATAECISSIYQDEIPMVEGSEMMTECDDEAECMLDSMWDVWSDGLPSSGATEEEETIDEEPKKKKVQPWASRSSGSGTYVRDPKTGKMVNIDE